MKDKIIRKYNFKIKCREWRSLIKNYKIFFIVTSLLLGYSFLKISKIYINNRSLIIENNIYVYWCISTIVIFTILFNKKYPFRIHPSNMIFFSTEDFKKFFIKRSFKNKILFYAIISFFLGTVLMEIEFKSIILIISFWMLLITSLCIRYLKLNKLLSIENAFLYFIIILLTYIVFLLSFKLMIPIILLKFILNYRLIYVSLKSPINFDLTYESLTFENKVQYLSRNLLFVDMQKVNRENLVEKSSKRSFHKKLNRKNSLLQKNIISFRRLNFSVTIFLFLHLTLIIFIYLTGLHTYIPILQDETLSKLLINLAINLFVFNLLGLFTNQYKLLIKKDFEGMFLPFSDREILISFYKLMNPPSFILIFLIGLIFKNSVYFSLIIALVYTTLLCISIYFSNKKVNRYTEIITRIISFLLIYALLPT